MAADSRNKRASLIGLGTPWSRVLPNPDGTLDASDRLHLLYLYAGIAADEPVFFLEVPLFLYAALAAELGLTTTLAHSLSLFGPSNND
jgi:hypothetical protein